MSKNDKSVKRTPLFDLVVRYFHSLIIRKLINSILINRKDKIFEKTIHTKKQFFDSKTFNFWLKSNNFQ